MKIEKRLKMDYLNEQWIPYYMEENNPNETVETGNVFIASRSSKKTNCIFRTLALLALIAFSALGTGFSLLCYDKFSNKGIGK